MNAFNNIVILLSVICWTEATPVSFVLSGRYGQYMVPVYRQNNPQLKRSDSIASSSGDYQSDYEPQSHFDPSPRHYDDQGSDYSSFKDFDDSEPHGFSSSYGQSDQNIHYSVNEHHVEDSDPVSEHIQVDKPIIKPVIKEIGVPVPKKLKITVPEFNIHSEAQPYGVGHFVHYPVPVEIVKTIPKVTEVPKKINLTVEKYVPVEHKQAVVIEKNVFVPYEHKYEIKIPVLKTIHHYPKSHHGR